jgi:DNA-binding NtrC family response regulator
LDARRERGYVHFMDDLFLARAELLAGNREEAAGHMAAVHRACEKYDCRPMLDFELRLACEMMPGELMRLALAAAAAPARPVAGPKPATGAGPAPATGLARLVGESAALAALRTQVRRFAVLDAPVLVTGETGTGKELVARALHEESPRAGEPFIAVNCASISENLLESELFGHERGAFTGAARARRGLFEEAGEGTILLDEIGDVSPRLQAALLRVLENREIRRVGASASRRIACRIVAATNAPLDRLEAEGRFRRDLLFRLRRLEICIPPLRDRRDDVLPLAGHFLGLGRRDGKRPVMSADLRAAFLRHGWPGNVRELAAVVERMRLLNSDGPEFGTGSLGVEAVMAPDRGGKTERPPPADSGDAPGQPPPEEAMARVIAGSGSQLRRLERVRDLFRRHRQLARGEIMTATGIPANTATRDLKFLCAEGFIERITPTASPRTHYFRLRPPPS